MPKIPRLPGKIKNPTTKNGSDERSPPQNPRHMAGHGLGIVCPKQRLPVIDLMYFVEILRGDAAATKTGRHHKGYWIDINNHRDFLERRGQELGIKEV